MTDRTAREVLETEQYGTVRVLACPATDVQRDLARKSELHRHGDMRLAWVNAGDLNGLAFASRFVEDARRKEREALDRLLSWWPENSEHSQAGRLKGSAFADDLAFARAVLADASEPDGGECG